MSGTDLDNSDSQLTTSEDQVLVTAKGGADETDAGIQPWQIRLSQDNIRNWERVLEFSSDFAGFLQKMKESHLSKAEQVKAYMSFIELMSSISFALMYQNTRPKHDFYLHLNTAIRSHITAENKVHPLDAPSTEDVEVTKPPPKPVKPTTPKEGENTQPVQGPPIYVYQGPFSQYSDIKIMMQNFKPRSAKRKPRPYEDRQLVCHYCGATETPEWRKGPDGMRTLCNACGLQYAKKHKKPSDIAPSSSSVSGGRISAPNGTGPRPCEFITQYIQKRPRGRPPKNMAARLMQIQAEITTSEHMSIYNFTNTPNRS